MKTHTSILAGKFHGQRSLAGYSPWSCEELDMTGATEHTHDEEKGSLSPEFSNPWLPRGILEEL